MITPKRRPWYFSTPVLLAVGLLCFPPALLIFIWRRPWSDNKRVLVSAPIVLWSSLWLILVIGSMSKPSPPAPAAAPASPTTVAVVQATSTPPATATTVPTATAPPPTATAPPPTVTTVPPTPAPAKPTAPPAAPPLAVTFTGEFKPTLLRVGEKLVVELGLENKGDRPIEGLRIFSSGPWDKYTIVNVLPGGRFDIGFLGTNFYSDITVPPGQKRVVSIVAYPNEPGSHSFTFIPSRDTQALKDEKGEGIVIGGKVSVIR